MEKRFNELRERLLRVGVAPRHVRRYLAELQDHLADLNAQELNTGCSAAEAQSAALLKLGSEDELFNAMMKERHLRSWCARAPWATFGVVPLLLLAAAYCFACIYVWLGWGIFMPGAATPFGARVPGPIYGGENLYFQAGKYFYMLAPLLVAWTVAVMAARQRCKALLPVLGMALIAWMGGTAQIQASRNGAVNRNIGMSFFIPGPSWQTNLLGALIVFALAALPYFLWQRQQNVRHAD
jgi:hypothetical protein